MFLKRIDIIGFKSFAERISIDFVSGVTAVVGPNGSGKSNVTDAIRWVLGEQSAKSLRGAKMEDIIFSGSESRKALNYAEVALTLDNTDHYLPVEYQEVTVTRRVYRSGESEYQINNKPCRLKDIVDMFMDSGLGKEAFSIIGQGRIEEILSSKAEERRTIFEEAAGVLKYKIRKKKAEVKLDETQSNLNRVEDITHELEMQIEPLRAQSEIAKDFIEKKSALEKLEIAFLAYEIEQMYTHWQELDEQVKTDGEAEGTLATTISTKEAVIEQIRTEKLMLDETVSKMQDEFVVLSEDVERLEGQKLLSDEKRRHAETNTEKLDEEISLCNQSITDLDARLVSAKGLLTAMKAALALIESSIKEAQSLEIDGSAIEGKIASLQGDLIEFLNTKAKVKHELEMIANQSLSQTARVEKWSAESAQLEAEKLQIIAQLTELEVKREDLQKLIAKQMTKFQTGTEQLRQAKENLHKQDVEQTILSNQCQKLVSRKEALAEMEDDYQGFFQGVREVLKRKSVGVDGAVAELIQVPKQYTTAIETAMGASLQSIVVRDEKIAREAISYLKQNRLGRATFLPMSVIRGKQIPASTLGVIGENPAFVGAGAELINFDPAHSEVMASLLGNVLFAKNLKGANELAKLTNYRHRIVTLEGEIVNPGGAMTGGASKQTSSLLSRKNELETIAPRISELESMIAAGNQVLSALRMEITTTEQRLTELRTDGEKLRIQESDLGGQLASIKVSEKNVLDRLMIFEMDHEQFMSEVEDRTNRASALTTDMTAAETNIALLEAKIKQLSEQKLQAALNKESVNETVNKLNIDHARKKEQLGFQVQEVARLNEERDNQVVKKSKMETELVALKKLLASEPSETVLSDQATVKKDERDSLQKKLAEKRGERTALHIREGDAETEIKAVKRDYKVLTNKLRDEEIKKARIDADLDNRISKLSELYQITYEAAKLEYPLAVSSEEARSQIRKLSVSLDNLGEVNTGAIEEFARISERYDFLQEQLTDLLNAKATLKEIIREMDEEMIKRFSESFSKIQHEFREVFPILFGGGHAELKLTDSGDMLRTGVEIVAQPPGKKLQQLSLLSGGERALTAIALLFAILRVRPVPFCVLDEVEAALDEVNVHRFATYLKNFSKHTQFIVITHRKGTMEEADVLYGVIMQESGVSRLVSVRLAEAEDLTYAK